MKANLALEAMKAEYDVIRQDHRLATKYITGSITFVSPVITLFVAYAYEKEISIAFLVLPYIILLYYAFVYSQRYSCLVLSTYCASLERRMNDLVDHNALNWESSGLSQRFYSGWRIKNLNSGRSVFSAYSFFNLVLLSVGFMILIVSAYKGYQHLACEAGRLSAYTYLGTVSLLALVTGVLAIYTEVVFPSFAKQLVGDELSKATGNESL